MNILIVEDDAPFRDLLRSMLEGAGYTVTEAGDGQEALRALEVTEVDCVITDILMPNMDGYRLCYEIRVHPRFSSLPVIFHTATYTSASDEKLSRDLGADRFLCKPASVDAILNAVRDVVARPAPRTPPPKRLDDLELMQQYNQRLVEKLEQRNRELEEQTAALRHSEQRYRQVFESANDAMFLIRLGESGGPGRFVEVNDIACEMLGYSRRELLTRSPRELELPDQAASLAALSSRVLTDGRRVFECTLVAKDGRRIAAEVSVRTYSQEGESLAIAAARDITERKRAEEALHERDRRLRQILDRMFAFVAVISVDGILLDTNRAPLEIARLRREDVIGLPFHEAYWWSYSPDTQAQVKSALRRAARGETVRYDATVRIADEKLITIDAAFAPLYDAAGNIEQVIGCAVDITERKQLQDQFLRVQRMEIIGSMTAGLAHDLNNILAPMLMAAGVLKDKVTGPADQKIVSIIETSAQRGAAIIRQLLTFSRGIQGARCNVQPRHLLQEIAQLMHETFPRTLEIDLHVPRDLWTAVADATQLHQVVMNLCVNARDSMATGGRLTVSARNLELSEDEARQKAQMKPGRYVVITVTDTGPGIPPAIIDRIFDPFFTTKAPDKGTGLGLSTVLGIVKSHNGFVTVHSEPGNGATFEVYLPAGDMEEPVVVDTTASPPDGRGELILVIDDEAPICSAVQQLLEQHGYHVLTAANGEEAIKLFVEHRGAVRLVLTDLSMPVMGGVELIRALRIVQPRLPVIGMTGLDEESRNAELNALGVPQVLIKPYLPKGLLDSVHRALAPTGSRS